MPQLPTPTFLFCLDSSCVPPLVFYCQKAQKEGQEQVHLLVYCRVFEQLLGISFVVNLQAS